MINTSNSGYFYMNYYLPMTVDQHASVSNVRVIELSEKTGIL